MQITDGYLTVFFKSYCFLHGSSFHRHMKNTALAPELRKSICGLNILADLTIKDKTAPWSSIAWFHISHFTLKMEISNFS